MRTTLSAYLCFMLCITGLSTTAFAVTRVALDQSQVNQRAAELKERFAKADLNADGKLTREEAKGRMPRVYSHFDKIDAQHHGFVTLEDITAYVTNTMAQRQHVSP